MTPLAERTRVGKGFWIQPSMKADMTTVRRARRINLTLFQPPGNN
jgi:hypothetical protein